MVENSVLVDRFRLILLGLAFAIGAGTIVELATLRHWNSLVQLVPWLVVALVMLAAAALAIRRTTVTVVSARLVGLGSALGAGFGIFEHVESNLETGVLDATYADRWATMSLPEQLWLAASGGVGASPPLAPGFLAISGICLTLATAWLHSGHGRRTGSQHIRSGSDSVRATSPPSA